MNVTTQLNRAMDYIEKNISNDLALEDVSDATDYSSYHLGRLFYYITDMPLSEYIRKRKLSLAAEELSGGNVKVLDLAIKYGYDSADSFARAFYKQHGATPTAVKKGAKPVIYAKLNFEITIKGENENERQI